MRLLSLSSLFLIIVAGGCACERSMHTHHKTHTLINCALFRTEILPSFFIPNKNPPLRIWLNEMEPSFHSLSLRFSFLFSVFVLCSFLLQTGVWAPLDFFPTSLPSGFAMGAAEASPPPPPAVVEAAAASGLASFEAVLFGVGFALPSAGLFLGFRGSPFSTLSRTAAVSFSSVSCSPSLAAMGRLRFFCLCLWFSFLWIMIQTHIEAIGVQGPENKVGCLCVYRVAEKFSYITSHFGQLNPPKMYIKLLPLRIKVLQYSICFVSLTLISFKNYFFRFPLRFTIQYFARLSLHNHVCPLEIKYFLMLIGWFTKIEARLRYNVMQQVNYGSKI